VTVRARLGRGARKAEATSETLLYSSHARHVAARLTLRIVAVVSVEESRLGASARVGRRGVVGARRGARRLDLWLSGGIWSRE
jgi:hypothetical protein